VCEKQNEQERFSALVPIPKLKCRAASCRPSSVLVPGSAVRPCRHRALSSAQGTGHRKYAPRHSQLLHNRVRQPDAVGHERPAGRALLRRACFRLPAKLCRAGFVNPQGRDERFLCFKSLPPFSSFPDANTPNFRVAAMHSRVAEGGCLVVPTPANNEFTDTLTAPRCHELPRVAPNR
jgi:hypothetical protein